MRSTTIRIADCLEQTFVQRVERINALIRETGVGSDKLRLLCVSSDLADLKLEPFMLRNVPVAVLLKYIIDARKISYEVREGLVEIKTWGPEGPPSRRPSPSLEQDDPFASPGE